MPDEPQNTLPEGERTLASTVNALARTMARMSPGDVASLRRLTPDDLAVPAFWKLAGIALEHELAGGGVEDRERRWAVVVASVAVASGLHAPGRPLGDALAAAGYSELRLARLLRAHAAALPPEVRGATAYLASKAVAFDGADVAALVLSDGGPSEEAVRRRIAKSYYAFISRKAK